jgi:hypothetical protein
MTSYIPNSATQTLTRSPDVCAITGTNFSNFYNAAAGTLCVDYRSIQYGNRDVNILSVNDSSFDNTVYIGTVGGSNSNSNVSTSFILNGGVYFDYAGESSIAQGVLRKTAFAYSNTSCAAAVNGTMLTPSEDLPFKATPIVNQMSIGTETEIMNISAVRYYKQRLSNDTLQTLTSL